MEIKLNGIELLQRIKLGTITNTDIIRVEKNGTFICFIRYKDKEIEWRANTFRVAMLTDDNYTFTVIDKKPIQEALLQVGISEIYANHIMRYIDSLVYNID